MPTVIDVPTLTAIVSTSMASKYVPAVAYFVYQIIAAFAPGACK